MPRDCTARPPGCCPVVLGDVQSRSCGGIQYTQHNMPKTNKTSRQPSHLYRGCRDAVTVPAPGAVPANGAALVSAASDGTVSFGVPLSPLGFTSTTLGASNYTQGGTGNVQAPPMRGLFSKAIDFQWYRVTRAKFCFVSYNSTTATGSITLSAYTDPMDIANITSNGLVSGPGTKGFSLASGANKELSVPIPVDSSWKRCTSILNVPGNVFPFTAASAGSLVVVNTVSDLSFGAVFARVTGAPASAVIGTFYIDYDVEFKNPIDNIVNT